MTKWIGGSIDLVEIEAFRRVRYGNPIAEVKVGTEWWAYTDFESEVQELVEAGIPEEATIEEAQGNR